MSDLLNPKVVEDLRTAIQGARDLKPKVVVNAAASVINAPYGKLTEWDFDIPRDNRFHDPFPERGKQPELLWEQLQRSFTTYEEAVHAVCAMRDLMKLVGFCNCTARYEAATDAIRRANYEEALQIITGLRVPRG